MGAPQDWPRWAVLLPHVLAAAGLAQQAGQAGQEVMADAAWLLDRAGTYLQVHARPADARELLEQALAIDEAAYGPDHPDIATLLANLAGSLRDLGQAGDARPLASGEHRPFAIGSTGTTADPPWRPSCGRRRLARYLNARAAHCR